MLAAKSYIITCLNATLPASLGLICDVAIATSSRALRVGRRIRARRSASSEQMATTSEKDASDTTDLATGTVNSAYSLIALQVLSRVATFSLNQVLLRLASPKVFGTAAIQLDLLLSTVLFISREGVRNALLRTPPESSSSPKVANVSTLPVLLGAPLAFFITVGYRAIASDVTRAQPHFDLAVFLYAAASLVDLLSEPLHNRAQTQMRFDLRVKAEGTAIISRSVFTVAALSIAGEQWSLVAFAAGQLAYALTVFGSYVKSFLGEPGAIQIFPRRQVENGKR
jgi:oligosaccharide translocation protein RFT1